jgi:hypothetical protein
LAGRIGLLHDKTGGSGEANAFTSLDPLLLHSACHAVHHACVMCISLVVRVAATDGSPLELLTAVRCLR